MVQTEPASTEKLKRTLSLTQLIFYGVGTILGLVTRVSILIFQIGTSFFNS